MSDLATFLERNQQFAADYEGGLNIIPRFSTIVLTCVDARVNPAHFLGLELGDAFVFRNTGARVTDSIELEIGIMWMLVGKLTDNASPDLKLAIVHHTNCGIERLANPEFRGLLISKLGADKAKLEALAIHDHTQSIKDDIERLRQSAKVPKELIVSGHIYDVETGTMSEVIAPKTLQEG